MSSASGNNRVLSFINSEFSGDHNLLQQERVLAALDAAKLDRQPSNYRVTSDIINQHKSSTNLSTITSET